MKLNDLLEGERHYKFHPAGQHDKQLVAEFMKAYDDPSFLYSKARQAIIFMASDLRSLTHFGADFTKSIVKDDDDLELWIIEHFLPKLKAAKWPDHSSKAFHDAVHDLKVEIMQGDAAVVKRKKDAA